MDLSIIQKLEPRFHKDKDFLSKTIISLDLPPTSRVIDIGTGWGKMAIYLALHGYSVITGEPEKWADWEKHAEIALMKEKIHYQKMDAHQMNFPDESVDAIFLLGTFHHIPDKLRGMEEFLRILKKDGKIVLFDYTNKRIEQIKKHSHRHPPAVKPQEFLEDFPVKYEESIDDKNEVFCFIVSKA